MSTPPYEPPYEPAYDPSYGQQQPPAPGTMPPQAPPGGQWQQGATYNYAAQGAPRPTTEGTAIASLVVSICSVLFWPVGLVGVILGIIALGKIDGSGGWKTGRGLAIAGIIIGGILLALTALFVVLVIAIASSADPNGFEIESGLRLLDQA